VLFPFLPDEPCLASNKRFLTRKEVKHQMETINQMPTGNDFARCGVPTVFAFANAIRPRSFDAPRDGGIFATGNATRGFPVSS